MLINKKRDMTPYNLREKPGRQSPLLMPAIWALCLAMTRGGLRIRRIGMEGLKPPFLVLAEHQGFTDYYIAPLALFPHRASYISDVEGFAAFGKTLYRRIGCIPTRRFTGDSALVRGILHVARKNRDCVVLYPEARHSNVGTNSPLAPSVGKLVKLLGIPVAVLKTHGSYLASPIWDEEHRRRVPLSATLERVLTPEEIAAATAGEITALLDERFAYDEYRWQYENRVSIPDPDRARGLHKVLYQCPRCRTEYAMAGEGAALHCAACGKRWQMDEYGRLSADGGGTEYPHIPHWYEWQRAEVRRRIDRGEYALHTQGQVEALPNEKGFVPLGSGTLAHGARGFTLTAPELGEPLFFSSRAMTSVHTEYDYRGRGDCLVLSTRDCCYYFYPRGGDDFNVTRIQFAAEYFHELSAAQSKASVPPV